MRTTSMLTLLCSAAVACSVSSPAHAATYGLVMPGDLPPENPLVTEVTKLAPKTAKIFVTWDVIEPKQGAYDTGKMDQYARTILNLNKHGIAVTVVFFGASAWDVADPGARGSTPPEPAGFAAALGTFAGHLAGHGAGGASTPTSFAVWNEADEKVFWTGAPEPDRYVDLLKRSAAAVRGADPSAKVVFTPLTSGNWRFLQAAYERGAKGHFDAVGVDADTACNIASPYLYYRDPADSSKLGQTSFLGYREVRKTMLANGDDKPILLEIGWSTATGATSCNQGLEAGKKPGGVTEAQQAQFLREAAHCLTQDAYVQTAYWFEIQDRGRTPSNPDENFGLLRATGERKPAYTAFEQAVAGIDTLAGQECGDFRPPEITVLSPAPGQQYSDKIDIQAKATDANGIGRITFRFDGVNEIRNFTGADVGNDRIVGLTPWYKSSDLPLGRHTIDVIAIDGFGNTAVKEVPIEKVAPGQVVSTFRAVYRGDKKVACKKRSCRVRVSLGRPPGASSVSGKILAQWQWYSPPKPKKKGVRKKAVPGTWKTLHKSRKPANKTVTLKQKVRKAGRWRLRLTHEAAPPYRTSQVKAMAFRVR